MLILTAMHGHGTVQILLVMRPEINATDVFANSALMAGAYDVRVVYLGLVLIVTS